MSAVSAVDAGDMFMLPPTYLTCLEVGQHADPVAVLADAEEREVDMFTPEVVPDGEEFVLSMPDRYAALVAAR
jgi:hypothetical protein